MGVFVIPLTSFVHGSLNAVEGRAVEVDDGTAQDLERAGLVRIRFEPPANKVAPGKAVDDGAGQPSSALPPAPALPPKTLPKLKRGVVKTKKKGR